MVDDYKGTKRHFNYCSSKTRHLVSNSDFLFELPEKWLAVDKYAQDLVKSVIGPTLGPAIDAIVRGTLKSLVGRAHYSLEMKAISERSKMDLGRLVLLQHIYEASACCTSIVLQGPDCPIHIRCMDWGMDVLTPLTIEADFQSRGETVFLATTWAGYLGVFTGMRPGEWSCSLNFRTTETGTFWGNLKSTVKGATPSGFLIRHLLESEPSFDAAVLSLATTPLIAPCYFTVCGTQPGQGTLITRGPKEELNRWLLSEAGTIVQTNIDHWSFDEANNIMDSIARRETAFRSFDQPPEPITDEWLWSLMSTSPILNDITIYATLMVPFERRLITALPHPVHGYRPHRYSADDADPCVRLVPFKATYEEYVDRVTVLPLIPSSCSKCGNHFGPYKNSKGECIHAGEWHSSFSDCNYAVCGAGLFPSKIGKQHWSCCFSVDQDNAVCSKSGRHIIIVQELDPVNDTEELEDPL